MSSFSLFLFLSFFSIFSSNYITDISCSDAWQLLQVYIWVHGNMQVWRECSQVLCDIERCCPHITRGEICGIAKEAGYFMVGSEAFVTRAYKGAVGLEPGTDCRVGRGQSRTLRLRKVL